MILRPVSFAIADIKLEMENVLRIDSEKLF